MEKSKKVIILIIILSFLFIFKCYASDTTEINQLIENTNLLDNTAIKIQGEVIGEALERGEYAWVNVNDGTNAIGVFLSQNDINKIKFYGDYKHKGDIVEITGTFYKACIEHGGDIDVHCSNFEVINNGYFVKEEISNNKIIIAIILSIITVFIIIVYIRNIKVKI